MSPYAAAGMLEVAHRLGLLPAMKDSTRHAIIAGLVGYGIGTENPPEPPRGGRSGNTELREAYLRELQRRVAAENALRQRDYDDRMRFILAQAAAASKAR